MRRRRGRGPVIVPVIPSKRRQASVRRGHVVRVDAHEQYVGVGVEDGLGAVAVMYVPIEDENTLYLTRIPCVCRRTDGLTHHTSRCDGHIVEDTEARRCGCAAVMPWWTQDAEGVRYITAKDTFTNVDNATSSQSRSDSRFGSRIRVGVE